MDEYIEKHKVVNLLIELEKEFQQFKPFKGFERAMYRKLCEAENAIGKMPAADVAPVTRCKDCKHAYIIAFSDNGFGIVLCGRLSSCENVAQLVRQFDDFCSYGERKDGKDG